MTIDELIERIRKKEEPERAKELISQIKEKGESFATILMPCYDDIHMKYDRVFDVAPGLNHKGVQKNGKFGIVDKVGNEIIPLDFDTFPDLYHEWLKRFSPKGIAITEKQLAVKRFDDLLNNKHDELVSLGHIKQYTFFNERLANGAEHVKLSDGSTGIAAAVLPYTTEKGKNIEIIDANGEHVMFLQEPEQFYDLGTPVAVICSDEENIYVATFKTKYSYVACYRMGDFERIWKTPMYGSGLQSITVNDDEVITFDINDGKIKCFDKQSGILKEDKEISTKTDNEFFESISQHNLSTTNESLLASVPGLSIGLADFENELKIFDNNSGEMFAQKNISQSMGRLNSVAIDRQNKRTFLAFGNKIAVFDERSYLGFFPLLTEEIRKLNFDQQNGCLLVSMGQMKGMAEVYSPEAIMTLLKTSKESKTLLEGKILESAGLVEGLPLPQEQDIQIK